MPNFRSDIMSMTRLKSGCPVLVFDIPRQIRGEIKKWVDYSRKTKNHPLAELKSHENAGYLNLDGNKHNSYQCSIPPVMIEESFWLAWVIRLTASYWGMGTMHRDFSLRKWNGHFDSYDIWTNFAYKGDDNPTHNHAGFLSGVIYYKNHGHPTHFDEYNCTYEGKDGTMVMFPSHVAHHVKLQTANKERITIAFNIIKGQSKLIEQNDAL